MRIIGFWLLNSRIWRTVHVCCAPGHLRLPAVLCPLPLCSGCPAAESWGRVKPGALLEPGFSSCTRLWWTIITASASRRITEVWSLHILLSDGHWVLVLVRKSGFGRLHPEDSASSQQGVGNCAYLKCVSVTRIFASCFWPHSAEAGAQKKKTAVGCALQGVPHRCFTLDTNVIFSLLVNRLLYTPVVTTAIPRGRVRDPQLHPSSGALST